MKNNVNFKYIFEDVKKYYKKFNKKVIPKRKPKDFRTYIFQSKNNGLNPIIGEIKFCSPKGRIREYEDVKKIALDYISAGVCGISVLTERKYFCGDLSYLKEVSEISTVPVLRKDFIFDKSQIVEAYYYGADSVLIISSFFSESNLRELIATCRYYGMEPIVEVHSENDVIKSYNCDAKIILINNRDKDTLDIDLRRTEYLSKVIDNYYHEVTKISASGISSLKDLRYVLKYADAALIGTRFMKENNLRSVVEKFVRNL